MALLDMHQVRVSGHRIQVVGSVIILSGERFVGGYEMGRENTTLPSLRRIVETRGARGEAQKETCILPILKNLKSFLAGTALSVFSRN